MHIYIRSTMNKDSILTTKNVIKTNPHIQKIAFFFLFIFSVLFELMLHLDIVS